MDGRTASMSRSTRSILQYSHVKYSAVRRKLSVGFKMGPLKACIWNLINLEQRRAKSRCVGGSISQASQLMRSVSLSINSICLYLRQPISLTSQSRNRGVISRYLLAIKSAVRPVSCISQGQIVFDVSMKKRSVIFAAINGSVKSSFGSTSQT